MIWINNSVKILDYTIYEKLIFPYLYQSIAQVDKSFIFFETTLNEEKAALAIINVFDSIKQAKIVSFVVTEKYRKQGIGSSLLTYVESYLQEKGIEDIKFEYFGDVDANILKDSQLFLQKNNWNNTILSQYIHYVDIQGLKNFRTFHRLRLPSHFSIIRIDQMDDSMLSELDSGADVWYKKEFSPIDQDILEDHSLILLDERKVSGWVVTKQVNDQTIHIDKLFVRSEYQRTTIPFFLLFQLIKNNPYQYGLFIVNGSNQHMLNLLQTRVKPYLLDTKVLHTTNKQLIQHK